MRTLNTTLIVALIACSLLVSGCVYYNTFYNARTAFDEAEDLRKDSPPDQPRIDQNNYRRAIEKSQKVVENHPNSKWYDDAVWIIGVSYFHLEEYSKAERRFREILANYPEADFATEAELYLAKSKLLQNEVDEAMAQFRSIFNGDFKREHKAEAAVALGTYMFERQNYEESRRYFMAVRDSLGGKDQQARVQQYIADGYFERFRFSDALSAYLQMLGMNPTKEQYYHALYHAALSSYRLQRIDDGLDYLNTLIEDERYYDSLGVLRLTVARGYEYDEDLEAAVSVYDRVHLEETDRRVNAEAAYQLGLIYQFDYDDLEKAKVYYDTTVKLDRRSEIGQEALQRSSDIGKLASFNKKLAIQDDTTATQAAIDEAGYTQYQLAELYWFKLNKPDTAMMEMRYLVDSMPKAYDAPKGLIALSQMVREREEDTTAADSLLRLVLTRFPHSDYAEEAIQILGLEGTEADTGYAAKYFRKAESFLVDEENVDSALYYYQYVVDSFPDSRFNLQARFASIYATELYKAPGDSSLILAYNEIADSFPSSTWANLARNQVTSTAGGRRERQQPEEQPESEDEFAEEDDLYADTTGADGVQPGDDDYVDPLQNLYVGPEGEELSLLPEAIKPVEVIEKFEYPEEAYSERWEGYLYFQIKLDFAGEVIDHVQKTFAPHPEINLRAERAVGSSTFNITEIREDLQDQWLVYKFEVRLPDHIR
jgi:tetratricopeptide (TPR) repeat protein